MSDIQLGYTILYVADVPATLAFYERAFGLSRGFVSPEGDFGQLQTGSTSLAFCSHAMLQQLGKTPQAPDVQRPVFEIALTTPDVAATIERAVQAGATLLQAPERMVWGQTVGYVADPNGFWVEICTPMG